MNITAQGAPPCFSGWALGGRSAPGSGEAAAVCVYNLSLSLSIYIYIYLSLSLSLYIYIYIYIYAAKDEQHAERSGGLVVLLARALVALPLSLVVVYTMCYDNI